MDITGEGRGGMITDNCSVCKSYKLSASMTVEASYVMAIVFVALAVLIRAGYFECEKTTQIMYLHYAVEQLCSQEEEKSLELRNGKADRDSNTAAGHINAATWKKEIIAEIHNPENALRKIAVFEQNDKIE